MSSFIKLCPAEFTMLTLVSVLQYLCPFYTAILIFASVYQVLTNLAMQFYDIMAWDILT